MRLSSTIKLAVAAVLFTFVSCSKDEKKAQTASNPFASPAPAPSSFQKSVLSYIPEQSVGFFLWQANHPAYTKLKSSNWGGVENDWIKSVNDSTEGLGEMKSVLKEAGIDLENEKTWNGLFSEGALFASPAPDASKQGAIGVVVHADPSIKLSEKLDALKAKLPTGEYEVKDLTLPQGKGVSVRPTDAGQEEKIFVGWNGDIAVFSSGEWALSSVLSSKGEKVPAVLSSPNFTRAARGLPADSARFATGFVDIEKLSQVAEHMGPSGAASVEKFKSSDVPLKGIAIAMGMDDMPQTTVRLVYDPAEGKKNEWLSTLNGSSDSQKLLAAMPSKPLAFLSIDGEMLRRVRAAALAGMGGGGALGQQLAFLDHIKRLGISARAAAPGQSLIPMPDILIAAESAKPAETQKALQDVVGMGMMLAGLGKSKWESGKVNDTPVESMSTPFGVGVYLASNKNLVLAASSQSQLSAALAGAEKSSFAAALPPRLGQALSTDPSLGSLYIDFEQVAGVMESAGGMLAMYAPEGAESQQLTQAENIEALKRMGSMVGVVRLDDGLIGIDSFSQHAKPSA